MEKPATKGSVLLQVLKGSLAVKVGLSETYVWGEATETKSLREAYAKLVKVHNEIGGLIQDDWLELLAKFTTLTNLMQRWEGKANEVTNDTGARSKREEEIKKETTAAAELLKSVKGEPERLRLANEGQVKQHADDVKLIDQRLLDLAALRKADFGTRTPPKMDGFENTLVQLKEKLKSGKPLTTGERDKSVETTFKEIKKKVDDIVAEVLAEKQLADTAEKQRLQKVAEQTAAKKLADEQQRLRDDWRVAVEGAHAKAEEWRKKRDEDNPVKRRIAIDPEAFKPLLKTLQNGIKELLGFAVDPVGDLTALKERVASLETDGQKIESKANELNGSVPTNMTLAVNTLTDLVIGRKVPPGSKPLVAEAKKAAAQHGIPGLHEAVIEDYNLLHAATPPQVKLQEERRKSLQGQADMWLRVGPWMHEVGMGGAPITGPNGPVFMVQTSRIEGTPSHFSQFLANAAVPAAGLASTTDQAIQALFADANGRVGPHLTLELSPNHGSPDNARLFKGSASFASGSIANVDQARIQQAMQQQLDSTVTLIRARLTLLLGK